MPAFLDTLAGLSSAEQFFTTLEVPFDQAVLNVSRLHILKGFHDRLDFDALANLTEPEIKAVCRTALAAAYRDFAEGQGARTFKVFRQARPGFVPLSALLGGRAQ